MLSGGIEVQCGESAEKKPDYSEQLVQLIKRKSEVSKDLIQAYDQMNSIKHEYNKAKEMLAAIDKEIAQTAGKFEEQCKIPEL